jgi:Zn-dependent protease with chaperone function
VDFFQAQDAARSRTRTLVVLFVAAVAAIIAAIYAVVHMVLGPGPGAGIDVPLLLLVGTLTTALVAAGSTVRTLQLRQGGGRVAELLGGRRVRPNSTDEGERRLINVVEEMSIASGTPVPAIYVLDQEAGINAFAAGYTTDDAAVAVTRGALDTLDREELQGVIAHEFSHILNGDMRLNVRLMGLLFGILLLAIVGRGLIHSGARGGRGRRGGGGGGQVAILGLALILVGYIGVFFGRLIQAAVSRQREYLADAAAVQFTRNPAGLAGALNRIGNAAAGSRLGDPHAQEAGHLLFANGMGSAFISLMATHPPIDERIRRIEPQLVARAGTRVSAGPAAGAGRRMAAAATAGAGAGTATAGATTVAGATAVPRGIPGAALLASIGAPQPEHVANARRFLSDVPAGVLAAAHDPDAARALLFALFLRPVGEERSRQKQAILAHGGDPLWSATVDLAMETAGLGPRARLPLLEVLLPALRELSPSQQQDVLATARELAQGAAARGLTSPAMMQLLHRQLGRDAAASGAGPTDGHAELEIVLSAVAWSGAADQAAATTAFEAGAGEFRPAGRGLALQPQTALDGRRVLEALGRLHGAPLALRRRVLEACTVAVAHDGRVEAAEADLLRAVAEAIELPLPIPH